MHIHITTVGLNPTPIKKVLDGLKGIDQLFLLHTEGSKQVAEDVKKDYERPYRQVFLKQIPMSDFMGIVKIIYNIYEESRGKNVEFSINITSGTNLMTAAICYSAYYIRAKIYYALETDASLEEQIIEVKAPKAIDTEHFRPFTKNVLRYLLECNDAHISVTNSKLAAHFEVNPQTMGYQIRLLKSYGLIETGEYFEESVIDTRCKRILLTDNGVMIATHI